MYDNWLYDGKITLVNYYKNIISLINTNDVLKK